MGYDDSRAVCVLFLRECQLCNLAACGNRLACHDAAVNVHCGLDVAVPHQVLLHRYGRTHRIKPTSESVPECVGSDAPESGSPCCICEYPPRARVGSKGGLPIPIGLAKTQSLVPRNWLTCLQALRRSEQLPGKDEGLGGAFRLTFVYDAARRCRAVCSVCPLANSHPSTGARVPH